MMGISVFLVSLIEQLKYAGVFIGTFLEGPAVGLISGFLLRLGYLTFSLAYLAHVTGDLSTDFLYYFIGYQGRETFLGRFRISKKNNYEIKKNKGALQEAS